MTKKHISQRQKLAAVFASFSILVIGCISLCENMSLDYYSVLGTLQKVIPASIALGGLGWVMGTILDRPRRRQRVSSYNSVFLNDVIKNEISSQNNSEGDEVTSGS